MSTVFLKPRSDFPLLVIRIALGVVIFARGAQNFLDMSQRLEQIHFFQQHGFPDKGIVKL
jgi:hypothetical protein